jgi:DNA-binding response OmpR family regulator
MVRDMLPKGNFLVLEAKDGVEGLNTINQERPNLIMLDFLLPRWLGSLPADSGASRATGTSGVNVWA